MYKYVLKMSFHRPKAVSDHDGFIKPPTGSTRPTGFYPDEVYANKTRLIRMAA